MSFAQERLWVEYEIEPGNVSLNMSTVVRFCNVSDIALVRRTLKELVRRQSCLRTTLHSANGRLTQLVRNSLPEPEDIDLSRASCHETTNAVQSMVDRYQRTPFDLGSAPGVRFAMIRLSCGDVLLLVTASHLVFDGWSRAVLVEELRSIYSSLSEGSGVAAAAPSIEYSNFARWQRAAVYDGTFDSQRSYWMAKLKGVTGFLDLRGEYSKPTVSNLRGATQSRTLLDAPAMESLESLTRRSVTLNTLLLAAFQAFLHDHTKHDVVVVWVLVANRRSPDVRRLIGQFVNILPFRADFPPRITFTQLLQQVNRTAWEAIAHQEFPFEEMTKGFAHRRNPGHQPQIVFSLRDRRRRPAWHAHSIRVEDVRTRVRPTARIGRPLVMEGNFYHDLVLRLLATNDGIDATFDYDTDVFDDSTIAHMLDRFSGMLKGILLNPHERITDRATG